MAEVQTEEFDLDEEDIQDETIYPARPDVVQFVNVAKTHINHTYRNFSNMPMDPNYVMPSIIEDMTFHEKLYSILSSATKTTREAINWCHHGRAFVINDAAKLNRYGILAHFGYNKVQRFRKDLNARGYKRLGPSNAEPEYFYSEFLLQGLPHLLQYSPPPLARRVLSPDIDNEPNFEDISRLYPLPGDRHRTFSEARMKLGDRGCYVYDHVFDATVQRLPR